MHPRRGDVDECLVDEIAYPDITGLGVTIALILPMLMTTFSIFWGYFTLSLNEDRYNAVDALFIGLFSRNKALAASRKAGNRRQARIKALENIILSFADQQLIMGLAISVAIVCVMAGAGDLDGQTSTGALQMACSLAFFSCTTHISVISVVRDHYDRHRRLRNVRFAVGALLVGLICALQIITESDAFYYDYSLSVKCAIASHNWYPRSAPELLSTIISSGTITSVLMLGLARKMLEVLSSRYRNSKAQFYATIFGIGKEADVLNRFAAIDRYSCVNEVTAMNSRRYHATIVVADFVFVEVTSSLIWELTSIFFYFSYTLLWFIRLVLLDGLGPGRLLVFEPNFGQIMPLIILVLPFFCIADTWSELWGYDGSHLPGYVLPNLPVARGRHSCWFTNELKLFSIEMQKAQSTANLRLARLHRPDIDDQGIPKVWSPSYLFWSVMLHYPLSMFFWVIALLVVNLTMRELFICIFLFVDDLAVLIPVAVLAFVYRVHFFFVSLLSAYFLNRRFRNADATFYENVAQGWLDCASNLGSRR